jgi:hypothetical protein
LKKNDSGENKSDYFTVHVSPFFTKESYRRPTATVFSSPITMHGFSIPWKCLDDASKQQPITAIPPKPQKSFAQALTNVCDIPISQFPQPCVKGDRLAIPISKDEYMNGIDICKHNLHGRIVWPKGATPLTVVAFKNKLKPIWKDLARWGIISLGKDFYEFSFSSLEDVRRVRSVASWNLDSGYLKLFAWSRDFNPNLQKNTTAQVWVRLYGLAQEYWRPNILFAIASSIGTPICTDAIVAKPMFDRTFGQYARVLVDMDLSQTLRYKVLVERVGFAFFVELDYENLPSFCTRCKMVGHYVEVCKKFHGYDDEVQPGEQKNNNKQKNEGLGKYVQKRDGRTEQNKTNEVVLVEDSDKVDSPHVLEGSKSVHNTSSPRPHTPIEVDKSNGNSVEQNKNTPGESVKSKNLNDGISNQNRFNALRDQEVNEGEMALVQDGEISDENSSTQEAFEFVDATQLLHEEVFAEKVSNQIQNKSQERVQKDMQFLKDSWANMAENEENETRLLEALDKGQSPSGFQMVVSKARNKEKAKSITSSKNIYGTRSKTFK